MEERSKVGGTVVCNLSLSGAIGIHHEEFHPGGAHEVLAEEAVAVSPAARVVPMGDDYDHHWKLSIGPGESTILSYSVHLDGKPMKEPVVEGLEAEIVTGARVI